MALLKPRCGAAFAVLLSTSTCVPDSADVSPVKETPVYAEAPAREPVPRGIKGVAFGMLLTEAIAALPGLAKSSPEAGPVDLATFEDFQAAGRIDDVVHEAIRKRPRRNVSTTIGSEAAFCSFYFALPNERLSNIACVLRPGPDQAVFEAVERSVVDTLVKRHGEASLKPHRGQRSGSFGSNGERRWVWRDAHARFVVEGTWDPATSEIIIINASSEHDTLVNRAEREAVLEAERAERAAEEAQKRRLEVIDRSGEAFDRDL